MASNNGDETVVDVIYSVEGAATRPEDIRIGGEYVYTLPKPDGCQGRRYHLHCYVLDVPSYQRKCLVEALDGPDAGLLFTCSPANFCVRYVAAAPKEKVDA